MQIVAITAGQASSTAALETGEVFHWGDEGAVVKSQTPTLVRGLPVIPGKSIMLASGSSFSVAVLANGEMYSWGNNGACELGLPFREVASSSSAVRNTSLPEGFAISKVACGSTYVVVALL
eukprot:TRINITY_DN1158_c0_g1_i13.p5 TRINITY_DN1158_c0_g1~~TRINITY_DN1158_c0_g1_i13.p5  ORF type:complete len:121 (-),score=14.72 TRINITY_DN1158_c0_g1_i13:63-425(-)